MTTLERVQFYAIILLCTIDSLMWALYAHNAVMATLWPLAAIVALAFNKWSDAPMPTRREQRKRLKARAA